MGLFVAHFHLSDDYHEAILMNIYQLLLAYQYHYRRLPANCCGYAFDYIYEYTLYHSCLDEN